MYNVSRGIYFFLLQEKLNKVRWIIFLLQEKFITSDTCAKESLIRYCLF